MKRWLLLVLTAVAIVACGGSFRGASHRAAVEAYDIGRQLLIVLDEAEAAHLARLEHPTKAQLNEAVVRVERLKSIRDALDAARRAILEKGDPARQLRLAILMLTHAVGAATAEGITLPPDVDTFVRLLQQWAQPP